MHIIVSYILYFKLVEVLDAASDPSATLGRKKQPFKEETSEIVSL